MPERQVVIVTGRHRPHEILFLALSVVTGLAYTFGAPPPNSLAALLPGWALAVWAIGLALSGAVGLVGIWLRRPAGLHIEQGAMLLGTAALVWYTAGVIGLAGWRGLFAGGVSVAWAVANLVRAWQIQRDLRSVA